MKKWFFILIYVLFLQNSVPNTRSRFIYVSHLQTCYIIITKSFNFIMLFIYSCYYANIDRRHLRIIRNGSVENFCPSKKFVDNLELDKLWLPGPLQHLYEFLTHDPNHSIFAEMNFLPKFHLSGGVKINMSIVVSIHFFSVPEYADIPAAISSKRTDAFVDPTAIEKGDTISNQCNLSLEAIWVILKWENDRLKDVNSWASELIQQRGRQFIIALICLSKVLRSS